MKMYTVLNTFQDVEHEVLYKKGEAYPKNGYETDSDRIKHLLAVHKKYKKAFISSDEESSIKEVDKDLSTLTADELKEVKNETLKTYLESKGIEYKSNAVKEDLIDLILGRE
ncbi:hypothetical protein LS684_04380 [Cytobacillus spongiae]|uniref:hypothetical protein n=1 Tax=Cytobacillus spongiae TaxID=2901381 RepID=UPI001F271F80|nr:hypothetical protein [Cytobacillus spongiae]UII56708.1 hypothetical protein LS684_04380 [Cytobacillus spongiae]